MARKSTKKRGAHGAVGPREAAAFIKGKTVGAKVRFLADDGVPRLGTVTQIGDPGWFLIRSDKTGVYHNVHVASILNIIKPAPRGGGKKRHGRFVKLVAARRGTVLGRVRAKSLKQALRKYRAAGHSTMGVSAVRYGGKKRHAQPGVAKLAADVDKLLK